MQFTRQSPNAAQKLYIYNTAHINHVNMGKSLAALSTAELAGSRKQAEK